MTQAQTATFVRHDMDPAAVNASVAGNIAANEARRIADKLQAQKTRERRAGRSEEDLRRTRSTEPTSDAEIDRIHDGFDARERDHYATVRIIERVSEPLEDKRFRLIYGDAPDSAEAPGTGPFDSVANATEWFTNGGR